MKMKILSKNAKTRDVKILKNNPLHQATIQ